jgi:hypothetical protein
MDLNYTGSMHVCLHLSVMCWLYDVPVLSVQVVPDVLRIHNFRINSKLEQTRQPNPLKKKQQTLLAI